MTEDRVRYGITASTTTPLMEHARVVVRDYPIPPLVDVRCPHCRNLLARVSKGAAVEVKCIKCRTWLVIAAA